MRERRGGSRSPSPEKKCNRARFVHPSSARSLRVVSPVPGLPSLAGSTPGWRGSGKKCHSSQIALNVPVALVRNGHGLPHIDGPMQLAETHGTIYLRPSDSAAGNQERYNKTRISDAERSPPSSSWNSSFPVAHPKAALAPTTSAVLRAAIPNSQACVLAHCLMTHAPSVMRLIRAPQTT